MTRLAWIRPGTCDAKTDTEPKTRARTVNIYFTGPFVGSSSFFFFSLDRASLSVSLRARVSVGRRLGLTGAQIVRQKEIIPIIDVRRFDLKRIFVFGFVYRTKKKKWRTIFFFFFVKQLSFAILIAKIVNKKKNQRARTDRRRNPLKKSWTVSNVPRKNPCAWILLTNQTKTDHFCDCFNTMRVLRETTITHSILLRFLHSYPVSGSSC